LSIAKSQPTRGSVGSKGQKNPVNNAYNGYPATRLPAYKAYKAYKAYYAYNAHHPAIFQKQTKTTPNPLQIKRIHLPLQTNFKITK
jgi:hypothetical protein